MQLSLVSHDRCGIPSARPVARPESNTKRLRITVAALLCIGTLVTYAPVCQNEFVNYDDPAYITSNRTLRAGLNLPNLLGALTSTDLGHWHPLTWVSWQLDYQLFGLHPFGYHLGNLFFHVASTVLLFQFLVNSTGPIWPSAFAAALFGMHPLHVESVAWAAERKDVLSTFFWLLALCAYLSYTRQPRERSYLLLGGALTLSLMAKSMAITLPIVLFLLDYWPLRRIADRRVGFGAAVSRAQKRSGRFSDGAVLVLEKLPLATLAIIAGAITFHGQQQLGEELIFRDLPLRLENALISCVRYLGGTFWPRHLILYYRFPTSLFPLPHVVGAAALITAVTAVAFRVRRKYPYAIVGWLWFLVTLAPVSGVVQILGGHGMADRYTYVPLIGVFILISWTLAEFAQLRLAYRWIVIAASTGSLAACAVLTHLQLGYWHDSITLWGQVLAVDPQNQVGCTNYGYALTHQGKPDEALVYFQRAVALDFNIPEAHNNWGRSLYLQGRPTDAEVQYRQAIDLKPTYALAHANLAEVLADRGQNEAAIKEYQEAIRLRPDLASAHHGLAIVYGRQGRLDRAVHEFQEALDLLPEYIVAHNNLGLVLSRQGKLEQAKEQYQAAIQLQPHYAEAHLNLAMLMEDEGNLSEAQKEYALAAEYSPNTPEWHYKTGTRLYQQGHFKQASAELDLASRQKPDWYLPHSQLAMVLADMRHWDDALHEYQKSLRQNPRVPQTHDEMGMLLLRLDRVSEALVQFEEAIHLQPGFALAHAHRGIALDRQGEFAQALDACQKAVALEPTVGSLRLELAHQLWKMGHLAEAKQAYKESLQARPGWIPQTQRTVWRSVVRQSQEWDTATAMRRAEQICEASDYSNALYLDTLAAVQAAAGHFDLATEFADQALARLSSGDASLASEIRNRLRLYQAHQVYRQPAPSSITH